ncbi:MAG: hypothetical protein ACSHYB_14660 [Roseibacillus sp.]
MQFDPSCFSIRIPRALRTTSLIVGGLALLTSSQGQTVFTSPAGYVKLKATAAASSDSPSYNFVNHALAQKRKSVGEITAGGTDVISASASTWGVDDFAGSEGPHFVLITTGSLEGQIYDIDSNTADTLTLATGSGDTSALVGESFRIYQHNTLASVFGADPTAKGFQGGLNAGVADQVIFFEGGSFQTYFYKDENVPDFLDPNDVIGWVSSADNTIDVSSLTLAPNQGFIVMRRSTASAYEVVVYGDVIDDSINVQIVEGYNLVNVPYPIEGQVTLGNSGLYDAADTTFLTSLQPGLNASNAELVVAWNGTSYVQYFYKDENVPDFLDPNDVMGWVSSADNTVDVSSTPLDGAFFIQRKAPNPPLDWVFPTVMAP